MKNLLTIFILTTVFNLAAQEIDYTIPIGYESYISKEDYKVLVDQSIQSISKNYKIASLKDGAITLEEGQDYSIVNLHNLILKCKGTNTEDCTLIISDHFEGMYKSIEQQKQLDPNKFETLVDYFTIRIYQESFVQKSGGAENVISRKDLDGTFSILMIDLPSAFTPIQKEMFSNWDKTEEEVFAIAQANVNKHEFEKVSQSIDVDGNDIVVHFIENENYGASIAIDLINNAPEFVGDWGSVIAFPNKGIVNICKISKEEPVEFVQFIQVFKPLVEQFYNDHPQPISTDFFWYYQGKFTKINLVEENGNINVIAPMRLSELMTEGE